MLSNKTLSFILLGTLLFSLGGTFFALSNVTSPQLITGFATSNQTGTFNVGVSELLSISLVSDTIELGTCSVDALQGYSLIDSSLDTTGADNGDCQGGTFPSFIVIENDGNAYANVTAQTSVGSADFFNDPSSWYGFKTSNSASRGGCPSQYTSSGNFTTALVEYPVCHNLSFVDSGDRVDVAITARLGTAAYGGGAAIITFKAHPVI